MYHTCVLLSDGTVECWGNNGWGQLGDGTYANSSTSVAVLLRDRITPLGGVTAIASGFYYTCAVLSDGTIRCWGDNFAGQLGDNGASGNSSPTPVAVNDVTMATAIAAGQNHTCALLSDGTVECWGDNGFGQLGDNGVSGSSSLTPVNVTGVTGATAITAGIHHTCAMLSDGTIKCWGSNLSGALGDGTVDDSSTPVVVNGGFALPTNGATEVTGGGFYTCAVLSDGTVKCWGYNNEGQLGDGHKPYPSSTPMTVWEDVDGIGINPLSEVTAIAASEYHTCALLSDGTVKCWGLNGAGELGNGTNADSDTPVDVLSTPGGDPLSGATTIAVGYEHTCALLSDGTVRCWGDNEYGQLGNGNNPNDSSTPVVVMDGVDPLSGVTAIAARFHHTCALLSDGTVKCWGFNVYGQLGDGNDPNDSSTPVTVKGTDGADFLIGATAIAVGNMHTCALLSDGTIKCWGKNFEGELGNGTNGSGTNSSTPVDVSEIGGDDFLHARAIAAGNMHTCAPLSDGTVKCWGNNVFGQLGDGNTIPSTPYGSTTPVVVNDITGVTAVAAGNYHTCALISDGTAKCWGRGENGELGNETDGSGYFSTVPVATSPLGNSVIWTSSNPGVATIDPATGVATPVSAGITTTTITATYGALSTTTTLTVNPVTLIWTADDQTMGGVAQSPR